MLSNGYVGLAPFAANEGSADGAKNLTMSLLYQLKARNLIDHYVFAIYVTAGDNSDLNNIKFGSCDPYAYDGDMQVFKTASASSWQLNSPSFQANGKVFYMPRALEISATSNFTFYP